METPDELRNRAERYRKMALHITDQLVVEAIHNLAAEYDALAAEIEPKDDRPDKI